MGTESQAEKDADTANVHAVNCVITEDRPGARERGKPEEVIEDYTGYLIEAIGSDPARLYAAARECCHRAADLVEHPGLFRIEMRAIDLCRRAAEQGKAAGE